MSGAQAESDGSVRPGRLTDLAILLLLTLLYYLSARLGLLLAFESTNASPIWPPTGLAMAALYRLGYRYWPAITVGAFAANFAVFSANHVAPGLATTLASAAIAIGNTAEALAGALILRRLIGTNDPFNQTGTVFIFAFSVAAACMISALVGTESLMVGDLAPPAARANIALSWWLGDMGGAIVVMPALMCWLRDNGRWWADRSVAEIVATLAAVILLAAAIFGGHVGDHHRDRLALAVFFPVQAWIAYRFGRRGVTLASLVLAAAAVIGTVRRVGPFTAGPLNDSLILLDSFVILVSVTGLLLAADLRERTQLIGQVEPFKSLLPSWSTLLAVLCLTVGAWHLMSADTERRAQDAFRSRSEELKLMLDDRIHDFANLLHGAAGLVAGSHAFDHVRWSSYIASLQLELTLPGIQAVGYAPLVPRDSLDDLTARMHAEGFVDYKVWPEGGAGPATPVVYIEPFSERNRPAQGFDMYSEPTRRRAMELARDTGHATLSGTVRLMQDDGQGNQPGALLYLPIYRGLGNPASVAERRDRLMGFVYAAFQSHDMIEGALGDQLEPMWLYIYDEGQQGAGTGFYSNATGPASPTFDIRLPIDVGNRLWNMRFSASPAFEAGIDRQKAQLVLVAGSVISLLLFTLVRSLSLMSEQALRIAEERATALRDSEAANSALVQSSRDAILIVDERGRIVSWNPGAQEIFGYSPQEVAGLTLSSLVTPEFQERLERALVNMRRGILAPGFERMLQVDGLTRSGRPVSLEVSLSSWQTSAGRLYGGIVRDITERERTTAFLRGMFNESPDAILLIDRSGTIVHANARCLKLFGYEEETLLGRNVDELTPLEVRGGHAAHVQAFFRNPQKRAIGQGLDLYAVRADGSRFPVDIALTPMHLKQGDLVVATINDVSELKQNREALRASEERFHNVLEHAPIGMAVVSREGRWLDVNRAICDIVGYTKEELLTRTFQDITHPDDLPADLAQVDALLKGERRSYQMEKRYLRRNGQTVWVRLTGSLMRDAAGEPLYFIAQVEDITEQRSARESLRATLAQQTAILGAADRSIVATRPDGVITLFNRAAEEMLGYPAVEVIGLQTPAIFHDPDEVARRAAVLSRELGYPVPAGFEAFVAKARNGVADENEWTYIRKDGSRLPVVLSVTAMRDEAGAITGFMGIAADITERHEKDRAIREALHEKETLLKEVYHRVKNNLQVITSLFNLQARTVPPGPARVVLQQGAERVRAMGLVHEKLYQSSTLSSIDIADYVNALCRDLSAAGGAVDRGIRIVSAIEPIQIGLDQAVPLGLLMNELISNSFKHGFPEGRTGEIRITMKRLDEVTGLLEIADDGIGYPEAALKGQSTSLGLKLIETLSRQLNGELKLEYRGGAFAQLRFALADPSRGVH